MENKKENLSNTTSFSRSERKALERALEEEKILEETKDSNKTKTREEKNKSRSEEKEVKEILKDDSPLKPLSKEMDENTQAIKSIEEEELQVGELGKTQHFLNMTSEITSILGENAKENLFEEENSSSSFNPITWIGLLMIACFGFFIYLVISSGYDENMLLLIDSGMLLGIVFLFGISIICGKTGTKVLSILNLLVIIAYAGINTYFLYNWNQKYNQKEIKEEQPIEEEKKDIIQEVVCTSEDKLKIENLTVVNDGVQILKKSLTISDKEELEKITSIFKEEEGLTVEVVENTLNLTFDFTILDINQYKVLIREYLDYYRETSDFIYIEEDKILYNTYKEAELTNYECKETKEES